MHCSMLTQTLPTVSPPLSPDTIAWNLSIALADELGAAATDASVTAPAPAAPDQPAGVMDADDEEVVLQVENNAAIERSAKISALRIEWGGKGKGGILGDIFNRHQGKGKGGYKCCKETCKCPASALKDGCLKRKGETILNLLDQGILPGEHTVIRPTAAQISAQAKLHVPLHTAPCPSLQERLLLQFFPFKGSDMKWSSLKKMTLCLKMRRRRTMMTTAKKAFRRTRWKRRK